MDGFSGHPKDLIDPNGQATVYFFPPKVTSIYQPLDQGIIAALKLEYKYAVLSKLVKNVERYDDLFEMASQLPSGRRELDYCQPPHYLDAAKVIKKSWDNLSPTKIANSWERSRCLPQFSTATMKSDCETYLKAITDDAAC